MLYADHRSREGLREKYAADNLPDGLDAIVDIDLILDDICLREALGPRGPVNYIVAAHVFEHIPNGIGWLLECADALHDGGMLCLLLPDKRFSFDHHRATTRVGDMIGAHLSGSSLPAIYEHCARSHVVNAFAVWRGERVGPTPDPAGRAAEALRIARAVAATGCYVDAHCTVFTPWSFVTVITEIIGLGLIPFAFNNVVPTERGGVEFMAALVKRPDLNPLERAETAPRLDPRRHHDLPRPGWKTRLQHLWGTSHLGKG